MLFRSLGFKARILLVVTVLFMLGIWSLAWRTVTVIQADVEKLLADQMSTAASYVATDIDNKIQIRLRALKQLASSISPALLNDPARLHAHLKRMADPLQTSLYLNFFVVNRKGVAIADQYSLPGGLGSSFKDRPFSARPWPATRR